MFDIGWRRKTTGFSRRVSHALQKTRRPDRRFPIRQKLFGRQNIFACGIGIGKWFRFSNFRNARDGFGRTPPRRRRLRPRNTIAIADLQQFEGTPMATTYKSGLRGEACNTISNRLLERFRPLGVQGGKLYFVFSPPPVPTPRRTRPVKHRSIVDRFPPRPTASNASNRLKRCCPSMVRNFNEKLGELAPKWRLTQ